MVHEFWLLVITIFINVVVDQSSATNTTTPSSETNTPSTEIMSLFQKITLEDFFKFMPKPLQNEIFVKDCQNMNSETLQRLRNEYHKNKAQTETHTKQPTTRDPASTEHTTTPSSVTRKPTPECVNTFGSVTEHKLYKFMPKPLQNEIFVKDCQNMNSETLQRLRNEYHKNKSQTETHTRQPTTRDPASTKREQCRLM
uniref:Hypotheticial protein n=1 Tax=Schistosoma japonicum TaxID=6182 RepID=C1LHI4_SCHJA|nr:hypotheticial protein [Schistosoma japonicum]